MWLLGLQLLCIFPAVAFGESPAKTFFINLDSPPSERWNEVVKVYKDEVPAMLKVFYSIVPKDVAPIVSLLGQDLESYIPQPYSDEIRGISAAIGLPLGDTAFLNVLYEMTAFCTSIVAADEQGHLLHARNLDYRFNGLLRNITFVVHFQRGGQTVYTGTTFAGLVGLMTGQSPHKFTVSLDQRDKGAWWENLLEALVDRQSHFASMLLRDTLDKGETFKSAVMTLAYSPLIAPCYIIVGGVGPNEGAVITRDRISALDIWSLDGGDQWYLLETNYDHWAPAPSSDDRRDPAKAAMSQVGQKNVSLSALFEVLSTPPVLNSGTVYTTLMSAAMPSQYQTFVRHVKTS